MPRFPLTKIICSSTLHKNQLDNFLIESGGGTGPEKPQQPARQWASGAKSCRIDGKDERGA
jgi:hypothetical protein